MKDNKIPSPLVSLLPVFVLILLLFVTIKNRSFETIAGINSFICYTWYF